MRWLVFLLLTFGVSLTMSATTIPSPNHQTATFAGGCFWCLEPPYSEIIGIISLYPGYTGGKEIDPTYDQVSSGKTGHLETNSLIQTKIPFSTKPLPKDPPFCVGLQQNQKKITRGQTQFFFQKYN